MIFKRLHLGTVSYGTDTMDEIQSHIINSYSQVFHKSFTFSIGGEFNSIEALLLMIMSRIWDAMEVVMCKYLLKNVTEGKNMRQYIVLSWFQSSS